MPYLTVARGDVVGNGIDKELEGILLMAHNALQCAQRRRTLENGQERPGEGLAGEGTEDP